MAFVVFFAEVVDGFFSQFFHLFVVDDEEDLIGLGVEAEWQACFLQGCFDAVCAVDRCFAEFCVEVVFEEFVELDA